MTAATRTEGEVDPRAVIFDLDGTLIDTYETHRIAWRDTCAGYGIDLTDAMFAWSFGRNNPTIIERLWSDAGHDRPSPRGMEEIAERKEDDFRRALARERPVMPGVPELCRRLATRGWRLGIGTSAPRGNLEAAMDILGLADCIGAAATGDEVTRGKPDPEVFQLVATRLQVQPSRCIVVEDAGAGIDAAIAAGMSSIGIVSTGRTRSELEHASLVIHDFQELDDSSLDTLVPESSL